jgi:hypothetical protein
MEQARQACGFMVQGTEFWVQESSVRGLGLGSGIGRKSVIWNSLGDVFVLARSPEPGARSPEPGARSPEPCPTARSPGARASARTEHAWSAA